MNRDRQEIRVLVIGTDPARAAILEEGLVADGYARVMVIHSLHNLAERVVLLDPDVLLIDMAGPDREALESLYPVLPGLKRPIAVFVDHADGAMIKTAIEAGVSAYVVDGLKKERVRSIVEVAISRFRVFERLSRERDEARLKLADRKIIEQAKGLLMARRRLDEEAAYQALRKAAMQQNRRLVDIAASVITAMQLEL
ncbi:MAG: ANTAR domain-containing protein [Magnetococcales bacterium]|nr:ANTAR domain-containing protein [Magnetococcales bacterium]